MESISTIPLHTWWRRIQNKCIHNLKWQHSWSSSWRSKAN